MRDKITSAPDAVSTIKEGDTVMIGGFMACGSPEILIDALVEQGTKHLTVICNDGGYSNPGRGVGKLIDNGQVDKLIASHVGLNPEVARRMNIDDPEEQIECVLVPQGTLAERIRAGGSGLGGFLTPTGIGTIVQEGKEVFTLEGREYLLELPLKADHALIRGSLTDKFGNTVYNGTTQNFNPLMAMAADHVAVGTCKIVETGEIDPNTIRTAGIFIDDIVGGEVPWTLKS